MHRYNNQDHSMLTAIMAARNIAGARFDRGISASIRIIWEREPKLATKN